MSVYEVNTPNSIRTNTIPIHLPGVGGGFVTSTHLALR